MSDLTIKQAAILRYVYHRWLEGSLPTQKEIASACGHKTRQAVFYHLARLEKRGLIIRRGNNQQLQLLPKGIHTAAHMETDYASTPEVEEENTNEGILFANEGPIGEPRLHIPIDYEDQIHFTQEEGEPRRE